MSHSYRRRESKLRQEFALISMSFDGAARELLSMADVRASVAAGELTRATNVTVYAEDGGIKMGAAGDFAFLAPLFDNVFDAAPTPVVERVGEAEPFVLHFTAPYAGCRGGQIARWCVGIAEPFAAGETLCIVETGRAMVHVAAPGAGRMRRKLVRAQTAFEVGAPLAMLSLDNRIAAPPPPEVRYFAEAAPPVAAATAPTPAPPPPRAEKPRKRMGCGMWLILIIAALSALVYFKNQMLTDTGEAVISALPVLSTDVETPPPVPEEALGRTKTLLDRGIASATRTLRRAGKLALLHKAPSLKVTNACPMPATVMFYTFEGGHWTHFDGASWDFAAGASGHPTLPDGNRIHPGAKGLFYAAGPAGERSLRQGDYDATIKINGKQVHFRRADMERLPNGNWDFTLTC